MEPTNYDSPWKNILEHFLQAFLEFCLPELYAKIDWSKQYILLDKELNALGRQQAIGKRIADCLFKVWLKTGEEIWLLIHIEVQGEKEKHFSERMYIYNYRIFDRYCKPVISIAILADNDPTWRPAAYERCLWHNRLYFEFATIKLLDYANEKKKISNQSNPFAIIIWTHLEALKTRGDDNQRFQSKIRIIRTLYKHGFSKDYIIQLFLFIDWVLVLPEGLELKCTHTISQWEEEKKMRYISSVERFGIQRGLQQGIQQGIQQGEAAIILRVMQHRFGQIPKRYEQRIIQADANTLLTLSEKILEAESLEDLFEENVVE